MNENEKKESLFVIVPIHFCFEELQESLKAKGQVITEKELMIMNFNCLGEMIKGIDQDKTQRIGLNEKVYSCTREHIK